MRRLAPLVPALAFFAACGQPPSLALHDPQGALALDAVEFGTVLLGQTGERRLLVRNHAEVETTLGAISLAAPSYALADASCEAGQILPPGGECTLSIVFRPTSEGGASGSVRVPYTTDGRARSLDASLRGTGRLDCGIATDLSARRSEGVTAAATENEADQARGRAAGEALTREDGVRGGYDAAWSQGFDDGYHDPSAGYDAGYASAYATAHAAGLADASACNAGTSDGAAVGWNDGAAGGGADGITVGYDAGYASGYAAGAADCQAGSAAQSRRAARRELPGKHAPAPVASDPALLGACYDQGYRATRRSDAYALAYADAQAHNAAYQAGLAEGGATGRTDGLVAGRAQGFADGAAAGQAQGFTDGAQLRYGQCYDAAYGAAYPNGYASGYASGYDAAYAGGVADGYDDGYFAGCPT